MQKSGKRTKRIPAAAAAASLAKALSNLIVQAQPTPKSHRILRFRIQEVSDQSVPEYRPDADQPLPGRRAPNVHRPCRQQLLDCAPISVAAKDPRLCVGTRVGSNCQNRQLRKAHRCSAGDTLDPLQEFAGARMAVGIAGALKRAAHARQAIASWVAMQPSRSSFRLDPASLLIGRPTVPCAVDFVGLSTGHHYLWPLNHRIARVMHSRVRG